MYEAEKYIENFNKILNDNVKITDEQNMLILLDNYEGAAIFISAAVAAYEKFNELYGYEATIEKTTKSMTDKMQEAVTDMTKTLYYIVTGQTHLYVMEKGIKDGEKIAKTFSNLYTIITQKNENNLITPIIDSATSAANTAYSYCEGIKTSFIDYVNSLPDSPVNIPVAIK